MIDKVAGAEGVLIPKQANVAVNPTSNNFAKELAATNKETGTDLLNELEKEKEKSGCCQQKNDSDSIESSIGSDTVKSNVWPA